MFKVGHRWVVLRYKGQYLFLHSCIILESFLSFREFYFREHFVYKVVRVASRSRRSLNNLMFSTKVSSEELVLSSLRPSPFTKPFLTLGG